MKNLTKTALVAVALFTATASIASAELVSQATTDYVHRTNTEAAPGHYVPTLVVSVGGEETKHQIGSDGLTRSVIFNEAAALAWAESMAGISLKSKGHVRSDNAPVSLTW